jgi:hypothetical protein
LQAEVLILLEKLGYGSIFELPKKVKRTLTLRYRHSSVFEAFSFGFFVRLFTK